LKGTALWPEKKDWENSILFFETSEKKPEPRLIKYWLRNYAAQGILHQINGIIFGKPQDEAYYEEYKTEIHQVMKELDLVDLSLRYNMDFGHTEPRFMVRYGAVAEINCEKETFSILENGVENI